MAKNLKIKKALLLLSFLSSILLATSVQTNKIWETSHSLWTHTLIKGGNARAYISYAVGVVPSNNLALKKKYILKALEKDPDYTFANMLYGKMLVQNNKVDKGIAFLKHAVKVKPNSSSANYYLSKGYMAKGDLKSALKNAKRARDLAKSSKDYKKWYNSLETKLNSN